MKELEKFFKDIHRIADAFEKLIEKTVVMGVKNETVLVQGEKIIDSASITAQDTPMQQIPTGIPVSNTIETYTREQIALAMGRAIDSGKMDDIQNILKNFGVSSLVELSPDKYNDLVISLKQIGVDV